MINEFGEEISSEEVEEIARKIKELGDEEIDHLWFLCGIIYNDRGDNKALSEWRINELQKGKGSARQLVNSLLYDVPFGEFIKYLSSLEKD